MVFSEEIIFFNQECNDKQAALKKLADQFQQKELVKESFYQAILDRENNYPTGLSINGIGVAIPHTDAVHVNKSQIGFMSLAKPVVFKDMVDDQHEIEVSVIFMLGLLKSGQQVEMLQKLVALFQDKSLLEEVIACSDRAEFKAIMKKADIY